MKKMITIAVALLLVATIGVALISVFKIASGSEVLGGAIAGSNSAAGGENATADTTDPGENTESGSITNPNAYQDEETEFSAPWKKVYLFENELIDYHGCILPFPRSYTQYFVSINGEYYGAYLCQSSGWFELGYLSCHDEMYGDDFAYTWYYDREDAATVSVWYYQEQTITGLLEVSEREDRALIFNPQKNILTLNSGYYAGVREVSGQLESSTDVIFIGSNNSLFVQYQNSSGYDFTKAGGTISLQPGDIYAFFYRKPGDETFYMVDGSAECELGIRIGTNNVNWDVDGVYILESDQSARTFNVYIQRSMPAIGETTLPQGYVLYCFLLESDEHVEVSS